MGLKPNDIIGSLSKDDQKLLNSILSIEKKRLHIREIKSNTRNEKEIVSEIIAAVDKAVENEN